MSMLLGFLKYALPGFLLFYIYYFLALAYRLKKQRLTKSVVCQEFERSEWPKELEPSIEAPKALLERLGFVYYRSHYCPPLINYSISRNMYFMEFQHPQTHVRAELGILYSSITPTQILFISAFRDGEIWVTCNGIKDLLLPGTAPGQTFFDDYLKDDEAAWEAHCQRLAGAGKELENDEEAINKACRKLDIPQYEPRIQQGILRENEDGKTLSATWKGALQWVGAIERGKFRRRRVQKSASPNGSRKQFEKETLSQIEDFYKASRMGRGGRNALSLFSGALFLALGTYVFGKEITFALLLTLILHEAGHWAAMKITGHTNVGVYFIPLLGALTLGEKQTSVPPLKQLFIYLAGPLPGIALALLFWSLKIDGKGELYSFMALTAQLLLVVNYLNLFPVFPLDGGQIVDTFLLSRYPRLRMGFAFFSVVCLSWIFTGVSRPWNLRLVVFAILAILLLPGQWRQMKLRLALTRQPQSPATNMTPEERVFEALQAPEFEKWSPALRLRAAGGALSEQKRTQATYVEAFCCLALYLLCLYLPYAQSLRLRGFFNYFWGW